MKIGMALGSVYCICMDVNPNQSLKRTFNQPTIEIEYQSTIRSSSSSDSVSADDGSEAGKSGVSVDQPSPWMSIFQKCSGRFELVPEGSGFFFLFHIAAKA